MTKLKGRFIAAGMVLAVAFNMMACNKGNEQKQTDNTQETKQEITQEQDDSTEDEKITIMYDESILSQNANIDEFYSEIEELTGLKIEWKQVAHNEYGKNLESAFSQDETIPDIVLLPESYYKIYASQGYLWNMSDAWESSKTKGSNTLSEDDYSFVNTLKTNGPNGGSGLYGYSPVKPSENVTVIKKSWLTASGIDSVLLKNNELDFNTYYGYLKTMSSNNDNMVLSVPAYIADEAPYTQYLPEFYQQAHFSFYKNSAGQYADGFSEKEMCDALLRISTAVEEKIIRADNTSSMNAYIENFASADKSTSGAASLPTGTKISVLKQRFAADQNNEEAVVVAPLKENGAYTQNSLSYWCITTAAKNPQQLFDQFLDKMLDNGEGQKIWEETAGIIDSQKALNHEDEDSLSNEVNSVPATKEYIANILNINEVRKYVVNQVVNKNMSIDDGMAYYEKNAGSLVEEVLKSLNN